MTRGTKLPNYEGRRFGRLVVLYILNPSDRKKYYLCQCDCENLVIVRNDRFESKTRPTKSCGCIMKDRLSIPKGEAARNSLYKRIIANADHRKIQFNIPLCTFNTITKSKCYYCGCEPYQVSKSRYGRVGNGDYTYNGMDRLDSNIGYVESNVVPCCGRCNMAKASMSEEDFYTWIKSVYNFSSKRWTKG